jgi:plastocyanin
MEENSTPNSLNGSGKSKTPWVIAAIVLLALIGGYVAMQGNDDAMEAAESQQENDPGQQAANQSGSQQQQAPAATQGQVKSFTVEGSNFKFNPSEIRVKEGDRVRIIFKNTGGFHDWVVDEFGAATKQGNAPAEETIEFVANKKGTFEYYCSVGSHRQMGMKGNLIVE